MPRRKLTKEEFIAKARAVHGDKYGYDNVVYINNITPVNIICPIHGIFQQTPKKHKVGQGCPHCAREAQTKTTEQFIADARAVHGDKYTYDKVKYAKSNEKVIITCPIHGDFPMTPNNHANLKKGCPNCAIERRTDSLEEFIAKARVVHRDKYNYDKVEYVNNSTPVIITCPKHGDFTQLPNNHKNGCGCPGCATERRIEAETDTLEEFIEKARRVHGDKYNYDKVEYANDITPVMITCPIHGDFTQRPTEHKNGHGCQKCKQSHLESKTMLLLERNNIKYETEKTFPWLRNKREMPLDFYLPEYNVAIECQGIQHFLTESNGYFTDEGIKSTQQNDKLKFKLCNEHNIPICYIRYDENIEEKVNKLIGIIETKQKLSTCV